MSAPAILPPHKSEKASGLWSRLKKNLNLEPSNTLVVQRRNPLDPRENGIRRNRSHGDFVPDLSYTPTNGSVSTLGRENSLKSVQLQLAHHDRDNNILNSKPVPKKIQPPTAQYFSSKNKVSTECNGRREMRRAATMSSIGYDKLMRRGSERSFSNHSSEHLSMSRPSLSPSSGPSRSPIDNVSTYPRQGGKALWGRVRQHYAPRTTALRNEPPVPKLATFTELWNTIFDIVRENEMLNLDEPDPRLWWRKVFMNMRRRHGKGKTVYLYFVFLMFCRPSDDVDVEAAETKAGGDVATNEGFFDIIID